MRITAVTFTALALALGLFADRAFAQGTTRGIVYSDANGNNLRESGERGVPSVAVSNGVNVVLTDQNGRYALPISEDQTIFVIKPSGYKVPLNELNQPAYYYVHKPNGSPKLRYKAFDPTGPLPASVDFGLVPANESKNFTALIFGDPQPYTIEEVGFFARGVVSEVKGIKNVAFGISLGDIVGDDLDLFLPYRKVVAEVGIPWYNVYGNHDMNFDAKTDELADETFEYHFGPANYAFVYGDVHFIVLDDVLYPDPRDGQSYWGGYRKDQLDFLENYLRFVPKDKLIVTSFHIPLLHQNENVFRNADRQRMFDLLKDYPNTLSMSAHTHLQRHNFYGKEDGWHQAKPHHEYNAGTTSGDWYSGEITPSGVPDSTMRDGTPRGYAFLHVNGTRYSIDYKVAEKPRDYQIKLFHPKVVAAGRSTSAGIFANFFMGYKTDKVEYRIGNGEWTEMRYTEAPDPSYSLSVYRWDVSDVLFAGRRPSNPVNSTHLWRGAIPANLPVGEHRIEVRATDMFGRIFVQQGSFRIDEKVALK
ncbi:MAG: calcineurin-like phosphoesterase C-terminal domain-containing protein [Pyrinomonadaceae bacterium]